MLPRPNDAAAGTMKGHTDPSMEGRVLPRPNFDATARGTRIRVGLQWRVGCYPDRMPAAGPPTRHPSSTLQWRVGCYPDRICQSHPNSQLATTPSMEGRVLPRPNEPL